MQYTNTPAWEAASTAASTRPRRTEKNKKQSNSHAISSFLKLKYYMRKMKPKTEYRVQ